MEYIDSIDNNFIKKIRKLKMHKYREQERLFTAEGIKFIDFDVLPAAVILEENCNLPWDKMSKLNAMETRKVIVSQKVFSSVTSQENPQGMIFVYNYLPVDKIKDNNIIILDKVSDPGNLGTIMRIIDAVGYHDVILTAGSVDIYNEKAVRSSMGSLLSLNITYMEQEELLSFLSCNKYNIISTTLSNDPIPYDQMILKEKNAFIFGNEGNGITDTIIEKSNEKIIIPIYGSAESLNVSVACGIILYKSREILKK